MRIACAAWLFFIAALPAGATETASVSFETRETSNALDGPVALSDSVALTGLSTSHLHKLSDGHLRLSLDARASFHRRYAIEDDRSLQIAVERLVRLSPALELRGTLSYGIVSEGDDLLLLETPIGIRTSTQRFGGVLEAGVALAEGLSLVAAMGASEERSGRTHFESDLAEAVKLEPDRTRLRLSLGLKQTSGRLTYAALASTEALDAEVLGDPPVQRSFGLHALRVEAGFADPGGLALQASVGFGWLRDNGGLHDRVHPLVAIAAAVPLAPRLVAKARLGTAFEIDDTDDPLASFVRRGEVEIAWQPIEKWTFGAGLFRATARNLLLENEERSWGAYGSAQYAMAPGTRLELRLDQERTRTTILDLRERTTAGFLRIARSL